MSVTYELKNASAQDAQKKVIELVLEYNYTGSVTPADTVVTIQNPDVLMIETESTSAQGTTDLSTIYASGETVTFGEAADDSAGEYNMLVRVGQKVKRFVGAQIINKVTGAVIPCIAMTAPTDYLLGEDTAGDDDLIVLNPDHGADLTAANLDLMLKVYFILDY